MHEEFEFEEDAGMTGTVDIDRSRSCQGTFASPAEWFSLCTTRHNVLLEGMEASTAAVLTLLDPYLCEPVAWRRPHAPLEFPIGKCGALVVQEVGTLDAKEQAQLLMWLDDSRHRAQIVATTDRSLFPLVARGLFNAALYYRLNVMLLQLDSMNLVEPDAPDADEDTASETPSTTTSTLQFA
jgi:hypothetical protein